MARAYMELREGTPMRAAEAEARIAGLTKMASDGDRIEGVLAEGVDLAQFESCVRGRLGKAVMETGRA